MLYFEKMKKKLRTVLAIAIIVATVTAFVYYIKNHPDTLESLRRVSPLAVAALLALYAVGFLAYVIITRASLWIYGKTLSRQENILFNAYSSLINFFGPGQSGPIFRGAYLKKRHNLGIKQFTFTMLLYLGFFAVINAFLAFAGSRPWWQTALLMVFVGVAGALFVRRYKKRSHIEMGSGFNLFNVGLIFAGTLLQVATFCVIYGIELNQAGANASIGQIMSYTGVANFSLYVALTPGAIGIREGFLVFSQNLHQIDSTTIVAANILDRGVYLVFLGLLFILVLALHARDKLQVSKLTAEEK